MNSQHQFISFVEYIFERDNKKMFDEAKNYNFKREVVCALAENTTDLGFKFVLEHAISENLHEKLWEGDITEDYYAIHLNEAKFAEWVKKKGQAAVDKIKSGGKAVKDKAVKVTAKVLSSFGSFAKTIIGGITSFLKKAWEWCREKVNKKYDSVKEKTIEEAAKRLKKKEETLSTETKNLGEVCVAGIKFVSGGAAKDMGKDIKSAGGEVKESFLIEHSVNYAIVECINDYGQDFIDEINRFDNSLLEGGKEDSIKIPGLSWLAKKLGDAPFFKQIHKIGDLATKFSNKALDKASYLVNKFAGGPGPFKFVVMGTIVGITIGYIAEHKIHHGIDHILEDLAEKGLTATIALAIPAIGVIVGLAFKLATGLWYYSTGQAVVGMLGGEFAKIEDAIAGGTKSQEDIMAAAKKNSEDKDKSDEKKEKE